MITFDNMRFAYRLIYCTRERWVPSLGRLVSLSPEA
jgi:hypothetical protein